MNVIINLVFTSYIYSSQEEHSVVLHFANLLRFFLILGSFTCTLCILWIIG